MNQSQNTTLMEIIRKNKNILGPASLLNLSPKRVCEIYQFEPTKVTQPLQSNLLEVDISMKPKCIGDWEPISFETQMDTQIQ